MGSGCPGLCSAPDGGGKPTYTTFSTLVTAEASPFHLQGLHARRGAGFATQFVSNYLYGLSAAGPEFVRGDFWVISRTPCRGRSAGMLRRPANNKQGLFTCSLTGATSGTNNPFAVCYCCNAAGEQLEYVVKTNTHRWAAQRAKSAGVMRHCALGLRRSMSPPSTWI